MNSIHVFEAFTELNRKAREEKRIISQQEFENFAREYNVHQSKKDFIEEWWDFRFMKVLKLIDSNTSEEEYQETLEEYREEKEKKRLERKMNSDPQYSEIQHTKDQKETFGVKSYDPEYKNNNEDVEQDISGINELDRENFKKKVSRLIEKLASLL